MQGNWMGRLVEGSIEKTTKKVSVGVRAELIKRYHFQCFSHLSQHLAASMSYRIYVTLC